MSYFELRLTLYQQSLKQLLATISQATLMITLLMYIALPSVFFFFLISLSVIAEPATSAIERISYQTLYLWFIVLMISLQRRAILASDYHYFLENYPASKIKKATSQTILTIVAGNIPLIAPLVLLTYMPNVATLINQNYYPCFIALLCVVTWSCVRSTSIKWFSLIVYPITILTLLKYNVISYANFGCNAINFLWLTIFIIEHKFPIKLAINAELKTLYYWQILIKCCRQEVFALASRLASITLINSMFLYLMKRNDSIDLTNVKFALITLTALIVATSQFDIEKFRTNHKQFLSTLPLNHIKLRLHELAFMLVILTIVFGLQGMVIEFNTRDYFTYLLAAFLTLFSIVKFGKNFFILPIVVMFLLGFFYHIKSSGI